MRRNGPQYRIDWFRVIVDLTNQKIRTRKIAFIIQTAHPTVLGWKQGTEPRHDAGERLIRLWMEATGKPRERVPTTMAPPWLHP